MLTNDNKRAFVLLWGIIAVATLLTAAIIVTVGARVWQIGLSGPGGWQWKYYALPANWTAWALVPPVVAFLAIVTLTLTPAGFRMPLLRWSSVTQVLRFAILFLSLWGLWETLPEIAPLGTYEGVLTTSNPYAGGYYLEAVQATRVMGVRDYLRRYPQRIGSLEVIGPMGHLADHPPGAVLVHWFLNALMAGSPALAETLWPVTELNLQAANRAMELMRTWLTQAELAGMWASMHFFRLAAALAALAALFLARSLYTQEASWLAAALTALIPSLHLFGPYPDQVLPVLAVSAYLAYHMALRRKSRVWAAAGGALLFVGMQFSLAFLAVIALIAISFFLTLFFISEARPSLRSGATLAVAGLCGFVLPLLAAWCFLDYDSLSVWMTCYRKHASFAVVFPRPYFKWVLFAPVEASLFAGVPLACLFLLALWRNRSAWRPGKQPMDVLPWSLVILLAVLSLSGKNLGEVGRLWMFLMPFGSVAVAGLLAGHFPRWRLAAAAVLALMFAQLICFRGSLDVFTP